MPISIASPGKERKKTGGSKKKNNPVISVNRANLTGPVHPGHLFIYLSPEVISPAVLGSEPEAGRQPGVRKGHVPSLPRPPPMPSIGLCQPYLLLQPIPATPGGDGDVPRGGGTMAVPSWKGVRCPHGHRQEVGGRRGMLQALGFPLASSF